MMALHFANASETVNQSISSIIPPADISFVKVDRNVALGLKKKNYFKFLFSDWCAWKYRSRSIGNIWNKFKLELYIRAIENYIFYLLETNRERNKDIIERIEKFKKCAYCIPYCNRCFH